MIDIISDIIVILCLLTLFTAIIINFFESKSNIQKRKKSVVDTGSMTGFFALFYILLRFKIGYFEISELASFILKPLGLIILIMGTYINIKGRIDLGLNWANQVTIYTDQKLITTGIYKYIRHPLYGSIIYMFYGSCLIYPNYLAFLCNTLIFIPFMYYRARQEEKFLIEKFSDYRDYIKKTGMLFPKIY
jgi:protein-S-isoprenylcysteine O-methyltransferase Ste14